MTASDERTAITALRRELTDDGAKGEPVGVILFCSPTYNLERLGDEISEAFQCPVAGCTTAGQIGPRGFQPNGVVAAALFSDAVKLHVQILEPLVVRGKDVSSNAFEKAATLVKNVEHPAFGLLFADGLSLVEEYLVAGLHHALHG